MTQTLYPLLENTLPEFRNPTVRTNANMAFGGNVTIDGTLTTAAQIQGSEVVTASGANAFAVGPNGTTNPSFNVDASTASAATGLNVKAAAAAAGLAVSVLSSGTDENLTVNAKGAGTITLNNTATGNIVLGRAATGVSFSGTGAVTAFSGTAVPAGGTQDVGFLMSSVAHLGIFFGSTAPTLSAAQGSLYIRTDGSSTSTRLYVNTNGTTGWTNVTTAA